MFNVTCLDSYGNVVTAFTQWDINQTLYIEDSGFDTAPLFHFCNQNTKNALCVQSELNSSQTLCVKVPNQLLTEPYPIMVYVYVGSGDSYKTIEYLRFPLRPRQKPHNFLFKENVEVIFLKDLIAEVRALNQNITDAENERIQHEVVRIANENTRITNEGRRKQAETARAEAESDRTAAENARQADEASRVRSENERENSENERNTNESARQSAETKRDKNETARNSEEAARNTNEQQRIANENVRIQNETDRQNSVSQALGNVDNKIGAMNALEASLEKAEGGRAAAEKERVSEFQNKTAEVDEKLAEADTLIENIGDAKSNADAALNSADTAAEKAAEAAGYAAKAESFARGGTGTREGEDADNAKEYARQAKESAEKAYEIAGGDFIPNSQKGTADGVATLDSSGRIPTEQLPDSAGAVKGVKGNAESGYRTGHVNLTPENIGALPVNGNAVSATKAVQDGNGNVIADTYVLGSGLRFFVRSGILNVTYTE